MWTQCFANGRGTHANSEIVLLQTSGVQRFHSFAGIDKNFDTAGSQDTPIVANGP